MFSQSSVILSIGGVCIGSGGLRPGSGEGSASRRWGDLYPGCLYLGKGSTWRGGDQNPPLDTMEYWQRAGGTHPAGIHSCCSL